MNKNPSLSKYPKSPVWNHPSFKTSSVASWLSTYPIITVGPWASISPIPSLFASAIFTSNPGRGKPTEPARLYLSFSPAKTGEVSVKP